MHRHTQRTKVTFPSSQTSDTEEHKISLPSLSHIFSLIYHTRVWPWRRLLDLSINNPPPSLTDHDLFFYPIPCLTFFLTFPALVLFLTLYLIAQTPHANTHNNCAWEYTACEIEEKRRKYWVCMLTVISGPWICRSHRNNKTIWQLSLGGAAAFVANI